MARYAILKSFYASQDWQNFRKLIIAKRNPICETCGKIIANSKECEVDHYPIELTPENVNDVNISLNQDNIKVRCHNCHNERHNRFGHKAEHNVYIVFGAPLSGKNTFVRQNIRRGDLIVDMDRLYSAVSMLPYFDKPDSLFNNVIGLYNQLVDNIRTRYGKWNNAYVVGGLADKYKREKLANDLGAELVFCDVSKAECLRRLELDTERQCRKDEWTGYINKWFERYME